MSCPSNRSEADSTHVAIWRHDGKPAIRGPYNHYAGWTNHGEARTIRQSTKDANSSAAGQCTASQQPTVGPERRFRAPPSRFVLTMKDNYLNEYLDMERPRAIDYLPPTTATGAVTPASHLWQAKAFMKELSALMPVGTVDPRSGTATKVSDFLGGRHLHPWVTVIGSPKDIRKEARTRQTFISVVEPPAWERAELDVCVACAMENADKLASTCTH